MSNKRKPSRAYRKRLETFKRNHGGMTPYQWQKRRLAAQGLTPYQVRKAREERKLGPVRERTANRLERAERVRETTVARMHAANIAWSDKSRRYYPEGEPEPEFSPQRTDVESRRGLAVLANTYHADLGRANPAYVLAFYNAMVNPESNYLSDHDKHGDTITPHRYGNRVVGNAAFHDYLIPFAYAIAEVDMDDMEAWWDERYSMALQ